MKEDIWLDLVNTRWYRNHEKNREVLHDPSWVDHFIRELNLPGEYEISQKGLSDLLQLRDFLGHILDDFQIRKEIPPATLEDINARLNGFPVNFRFYRTGDGYRISESPYEKESDYPGFWFLFSFLKNVTRTNLKNIRICGNNECRWVFEDHSKNHSKKWCSNTCASLIKVRNYRKRKSGEPV